jgi:hypothetical protein
LERDKVKSRKNMPLLRQSASASAERELTQAVRRVHDRYGTDLQSFFRDVQEKTEVNAESDLKAAQQRDEHTKAK